VTRIAITRLRFTRFKVVRGESVQAQDRARDRGLLRRAARLRVWRDGSLGLVYFGWRFAGGHSVRWSRSRHTTLLKAPFSNPFPLFSHFLQILAQEGSFEVLSRASYNGSC